MDILTPILIITLLIVINGLFVAAEFAIVASRKHRLEAQGLTGTSADRVRERLSNTRKQDRYVAVAQLGITMATIGLGMYGEPSIASWLYSPLELIPGVTYGMAHLLGTIIAISFMTYLHVVIGEMIPKAIALDKPERTAVFVDRPMQAFATLFKPGVKVLDGVAGSFLKLMKIPPSGAHGRLHTTRELEMLVNESALGGVLEVEQQELIENIFDFGEREVYQCMTPRTKVMGLKIDATPEEIIELMATSKHSRFPVYDGDLDHIIGILHVKDFIRYQTTSPNGHFRLRKLLRRAPRVPLYMSSENLLAAFKRLKVHMAIVMDEYGGTDGIVTMEDLLEEVVGEVYDEHDQQPLPEITTLPDGSLKIEGDFPLEDFDELHPGLLDSEHTVTIGGLIVEELGRPPEIGDIVELNGVTLKVESIDGLAVTSVIVTLPPPEAEDK